MLHVLQALQSFTISNTATLPSQMLGYAADVTADLMPLALATGGVFMGVRIFRAIRR